MGRYYFNNVDAKAARCRAHRHPWAAGPYVAVCKHRTQRYVQVIGP